MGYHAGMTKMETIAKISAELAHLDEDGLQDVAGYIESLQIAAMPLRQLSERELGLLAQSKADFAAGRTLTLEEVKSRLDEKFGQIDDAIPAA